MAVGLVTALVVSATAAADRIEVVGVAPEPADPTATVTRIDREAIDRAAARGEGVADLLGRTPGARIVDLGGPLADKRVTIRAGSASQARIEIDGISLTSPFATGLDVGFVDLAALDAIDVVRGGAGATLGDGALTGGVRLFTRSRSRPTAWLRFGSLSSLAVGAAGSVGDLTGSGSFAHTDGGFEYVSRLEGLPDEGRERTNNDADRGTLSLRWDRAASDGRVTVLAGGSVREGGVPGLETQSDPDARELRGTARAAVSWRRAPRPGRSGLEVGASASFLSIDYDDPPIADDTSRTRFGTVSLEGAIERTRFGPNLFTLRADAHVEHSNSTQHGDQTRVRFGVGLSQDILLDDWTIFAALRTELITGLDAQVMPRVGVRWTALDELSLTVAAGRSYRTPLLDELYHPLERGLAGNPDLLPESAWEGEATVSWVPIEEVSISVSGFVRQIDDTILYINRNAFVVRPENVGAARAAGAELELAALAEIADTELRFDVAAAVTGTELEASGEPLPTRPLLTGFGSLTIAPRWAPLDLFTRVQLASGTHANLRATLPVEPYVRWDAGVTAMMDEHATASLVVENLLDEQANETLNKIPLPGRTVMLTVRIGQP